MVCYQVRWMFLHHLNMESYMGKNSQCVASRLPINILLKCLQPSGNYRMLEIKLPLNLTIWGPKRIFYFLIIQMIIIQISIYLLKFNNHHYTSCKSLILAMKRRVLSRDYMISDIKKDALKRKDVWEIIIKLRMS